MPAPRYPIAHDPSIAAEQRISSDSHMAEPLDLWETRLPAQFRDRALTFPKLKLYETNHHLRAGGWDPEERLKDMALDGISAEVLFPTLGKQAWNLDDPELEEAHIRAYNDWLFEFCSVNQDRFWGLTMLSLHDVDGAIKEMERGKAAGMRGVDMPMSPGADIAYSSDRYEKLWAAAASLGQSINLHINSGPGWQGHGASRAGLLPEGVHKLDTLRALGDIVASGVFERHPDLRVVVAECNVGWIPEFAQEFDVYNGVGKDSHIPRPPSEYVWRNVYAAFISDPVGGYLLGRYGQDTFMWSNDFPHPACIWPGASGVIERDLGHLTPEVRQKVLAGNAARLYNGGVLPPLADPMPEEFQPIDELWAKFHEPIVTSMG